VLGTKRPHALRRYKILHLDHSEVLSRGRRIVDMWQDYCISNILSGKGKLQAFPSASTAIARGRL
jgi:hypothetical protein